MGQNEKIRTEDVIEILDGKLLTSEGHTEINVLPRENYNSVLIKLSQRTLSAAQKEAFDAALTVPSLSNPVVLKNDLTTYIPQADLGNVKDSVTYFSELPLPFEVTGDVVIGESKITNLSYGSNVVMRGHLVVVADASMAFDSGTSILDVVSTTEVTVGLVTGSVVNPSPANITATGVLFRFEPMEGDLRGVIEDRIIYRWNGTAWVPFTRTGTLDHTELINQNGNNQYVHLTQAQKDLVLDTTHSHANKSILDSILSIGSGQIITSAERAALPTAKQKEALAGTSGVPSASNPYVTNADPRLNAARNPYVTVGTPGSLATFQGVDFNPFNDALQAIDIGSASVVKAVEVLAGSYNLGGVSLVWTNSSSLLMENFTPSTSIMSYYNAPWGIDAQGSGGALIIRGFIFELNAAGTSGIRSYRPYTIIEDCVFKPGTTVGANQVGVSLFGEGSIIRRCRFIGNENRNLTKGIILNAANCRVENCTFEIDLSSSDSASIEVNADYAVIDHNTFDAHITTSPTPIRINSTADFTNIINNRFYNSTISSAFVDEGSSTRILENQPEDINQPFIGRKRTLGYVGTYADYRGNTEAPFVAALDDPNVTEIEVLEGTYTFASSVSIPDGKSIRGVKQGLETGGVVIQGVDGIKPFILSQNTCLENLVIQGSNNTLVSGSSVSNVVIERCKFNLTASSSAQYELALTSPTDSVVTNCSFNGIRGISLSGSTRSKILNSVFLNATASLVMATPNTKDHIKGNHFITTAAPTIVGTILLVENNHFLGSLPTKLNTSSSIWQGNYPHPSANNDDGVDTLDISLDRYLEPNSDGVERTTATGVGAISFGPNITGIASTLPIAILSKIDKTRSYTVDVYWSAPNGATGNVVWEITAVFRDKNSQYIGSQVQSSIVASRTALKTISDEDKCSVTFSNYNIGSLDPTHMSLTIKRLGINGSDTLTVSTVKAVAYLTEVRVTIPRD